MFKKNMKEFFEAILSTFFITQGFIYYRIHNFTAIYKIDKKKLKGCCVRISRLDSRMYHPIQNVESVLFIFIHTSYDRRETFAGSVLVFSMPRKKKLSSQHLARKLLSARDRETRWARFTTTKGFVSNASTEYGQ